MPINPELIEIFGRMMKYSDWGYLTGMTTNEAYVNLKKKTFI